jgi:hypothetical protein
LAKFDQLAGYALPPAQARQLADFTLALDGIRDARALRNLLRSPIASA